MRPTEVLVWAATLSMLTSSAAFVVSGLPESFTMLRRQSGMFPAVSVPTNPALQIRPYRIASASPWARSRVSSGRGNLYGRSPSHNLCMSEEGSEGTEYSVEDGKTESVVVLPLTQSIKSKDIECKITRRSVLLTVNGRRLIDGATWAKLDADKSFWEIDEYGDFDRCLILRLCKDAAADWPFLLRSDYEMPTDFAGRALISRPDVQPADVEAALQVLVGLMRPDGPTPSNAPEPSGEEEEGREEKIWRESMEEAREEAWRDAAEDVKRSLQQGGDPTEMQEIIEATQNAVQSGPAGEPPAAPIASFVFVRHSATTKAADDSIDSDLARMLTEDGQTAADNAKRWFGTLCRENSPPFGFAVSSSAGRCLETAYLMGAPQPMVLEGIYEGLNEEEARAAFAAEGYASVAHYITQGHGKVLRRYAERVVVELADAIQLRVRQLREEQGDGAELSLGSVVVFGHAVYSAAVALLLAQALRLPRQETSLLATAVHGEAEGLVVSATGTGHCILDSTQLPTDVDIQTAKTLSGVYQTLKSTGLLNT